LNFIHLHFYEKVNQVMFSHVKIFDVALANKAQPSSLNGK